MSKTSDDVLLLMLFGKIRRQLNLRATQEMRPLGIGPKQGLVIRELSKCKAACPMELARATQTDPGATGKVIDSLIKKDWIKRTDDPKDRRRWQVSLTPKGEKTAQKLDGIYREIASEFCQPLATAQKSSFFKALTEISSHLEISLNQAGELT